MLLRGETLGRRAGLADEWETRQRAVGLPESNSLVVSDGIRHLDEL